ncbi:MAG: OmpA family protein [Parvularcula sp.]|jgi:OOP family OmpA-OmpF porin|nr:OmpA family protein [Parvularcula sp.]
MALWGMACAMMMATWQPVTAPEHATLESYSTAVYFDYGRHELGSAGQLLVQEVAAKARAAGLSRVTVVGHTDSAGGEEQNLKDGLRRAEAVAAILKAAGYSEDEISVLSAGESQPARRHDDERREPLNRRATLRFEP